mgnify:FL=1
MPVLRENKCSVNTEFSINGVGIENDWRCLKLNKYELIIGILKLTPNYIRPISKIIASCFYLIVKYKQKRWFYLHGTPISDIIRPTLELKTSNFIKLENWIEKKTINK